MPSSPTRDHLIALGVAEITGLPDAAEGLASFYLTAGGELLATIEFDDDSIVTVRLAAHCVNAPEVLEAGRVA